LSIGNDSQLRKWQVVFLNSKKQVVQEESKALSEKISLANLAKDFDLSFSDQANGLGLCH
jgi:hypothetical protein